MADKHIIWMRERARFRKITRIVAGGTAGRRVRRKFALRDRVCRINAKFN
jgi:hypothetical protein